MAEVNIVLNGKGGIGKSFVSWVLAQFKKSIFADVKCFDVDPVNASFAKNKALNVTHLNITAESDTEISKRKFDDLFNMVLSSPSDGCFVIDVGASTFMPLISYIHEAGLLKLLTDEGHSVFLHVPIVGGQAFLESVRGLKYIQDIQDFSGRIVIWENEYFGKISSEQLAGKKLLDIAAIKAFSERIAGVVKITYRGTTDTFAGDMGFITSRHLTFSEALESPEIGIISKSRIKRIRDDLFNQISAIQ